MPTVTVTRLIDNACMLAAMRRLLGDPEWAPAEVVNLIIENNGFPSTHNSILPRHAPVVVVDDGRVTLVGRQEGVVVHSAQQSLKLSPDELVVISRLTSPGRGHAECMTVRQVMELLEGPTVQEFITLIARAKEDACPAQR